MNELEKEAQDTHMYEKYLKRKSNIPLYPGPKEFSPEFHASYLKHDTHKLSLQGIKNDEGFKDPNNGSKDPDGLSLVWFSLAVGKEEIQSAEKTLLEMTNMHAEPGFLKKFASSPAFSEKSRYGAYRFTFKVEDVLKAYSEQVRTPSVHINACIYRCLLLFSYS